MSKKIFFKKIADEDLKRGFFGLIDLKSLASLLQVNQYLLQRTFNELRENQQEKYYHEFLIRKKSGGERKILAPNFKLKNIQQRLAYILSLVYLGKPSVHGFRRSRNIVTNAEKHADRKAVFNTDLEDFFPTIHFGRVRGILEARPYKLPREVATIIAGICCVNGKLPQGAPTSPILSNILCAKLDHDLQKLAQEERSVYTRYADDITFSTTKKRGFSENIVKMDSGTAIVGAKLVDLIVINGFKVNNKKTRIRFYTERQEVTGLVVNEFPNVKRSFIKEVRMMLHVWKKYLKNPNVFDARKFSFNKNQKDSKVEDFFNILYGRMNFIRLVKTERDRTYQGLAKKFNQLAGREVFKIIPLDNVIDEVHIGAGNLIKAKDAIEQIFSTAHKEIFILDKYLGESSIELLRNYVKERPNLNIKILLGKKYDNKKNERYVSCISALNLFIAEYPKTSIDCREEVIGIIPRPKRKLHDRFIIIDNAEVYTSGQSFEELGGTAASYINRIRTRNVREETLYECNYLFSNANKTYQ